MKKLFYSGIAAAFLFFSGNAKAQGFYADINVGYGWSIGESNLGVERYTDYSNSENNYSKSIYGSLGGGLNLTLTPGYMINEYIGVEIGMNYFAGEKVTMASFTSSNEDRFDITTAYSNQLRILPSLFLRTGGDQFYGYAKTGLVMPVYGSTVGIRENSQIDPVEGSILEVYDTETKGSFSLGFRGAIGMGYQINDMIAVNLEVNYTALSIKPKNRTMTSVTRNGEDMLSLFPAYASDINYVDELNSESNNTDYNPGTDSQLPKDELANKTNFNQLGVSVGLKFSF